MKNKYVMIICRNCGDIQCYTEEYYNLKMKGNKHRKHSCTNCGNGKLNVGMKEIINGLKEDFKNKGLTQFKEEHEFQVFEGLIKKTIDKGFEIVKVESDKE